VNTSWTLVTDIHICVYTFIYMYMHIHVYIYIYIQWGMLQQMNAKTNSFINKIRMLQWTQMLQWMRRNTISWRSTRVRMTCRAFQLWLVCQSSPLLSLVRFSYQF